MRKPVLLTLAALGALGAGWGGIAAYFAWQARAPELRAQPVRSQSAAIPKLEYVPQPIGAPVSEFVRPLVTHIQIVDLDGDGLADILYCEGQKNSVRWLRQSPRGVFTESVIGEEIPGPVHVCAADINGTGLSKPNEKSTTQPAYRHRAPIGRYAGKDSFRRTVGCHSHDVRFSRARDRDSRTQRAHEELSQQSQREIGVRIALGADYRRIVTLRAEVARVPGLRFEHRQVRFAAGNRTKLSFSRSEATISHASVLILADLPADVDVVKLVITIRDTVQKATLQGQTELVDGVVGLYLKTPSKYRREILDRIFGSRV